MPFQFPDGEAWTDYEDQAFAAVLQAIPRPPPPAYADEYPPDTSALVNSWADASVLFIDLIVNQYPRPQPYQDDHSSLVHFMDQEEPYWAPVGPLVQSIPPNYPASRDEGAPDSFPLAGLYLDHHEPFTPQVQTVWSGIPAARDDDLFQLSSAELEDGSLLPAVMANTWQPLTTSAIQILMYDPGEYVFVTGADTSVVFIDLVSNVYPRPPAYSYDEINEPLAGFFLEHHEPYVPQVQAVWPGVPAATDDDLRHVALGLEYEEPWWAAFSTTIPVEAVPVPLPPSLDDEILSPVGGFRSEQEEPWWSALGPPIQFVPPYQSAFLDENAPDVTPLLSFHTELEEPCWSWAGSKAAPPTEVVPWLAFTVLDEDGNRSSSALTEEDFWVGQPVQYIPAPLPPVLDENAPDNSLLLLFGLEQEDDAPRFQQISAVTVPASVVDEELFSPFTTHFDQEDFPSAPVTVVPWLAVPIYPITDEDPLARGGFRIDHDDFRPVQLETVPWLPVAFADDDLLGAKFSKLDQEDFVLPPVQTVLWVPAFLLAPMLERSDQSESGNFFYAFGDGYVTFIDLVVNQYPRPPAYSYEEVSTAHGAQLEVDGQWWDISTSTQLVQWVSTVWLSDDVGQGLSASSMTIEQEEPWWFSTIPVQIKAPYVAPVQNAEESRLQPGVFFREQEEFWQALVQYVPPNAPAVAQDEISAGMVWFPYDDERQPTLISAATTIQTLTWLPGFLFEEEPALQVLLMEDDSLWYEVIESW